MLKNPAPEPEIPVPGPEMPESEIPEPKTPETEMPETETPESEISEPEDTAQADSSPNDAASDDSSLDDSSPDDAGLQTSEDTHGIQAKKIRRSDLTLLPRKFWPLANNSFLLHGYHNYNHLLLIEEAGHLWLGVPGVYDPREARAADLFGFPIFTREGAALIELSEEECSQSPDFGHWCRCVGPCGVARDNC